MAKITIETELGTKNFTKQINNLKADIERYVKVLESDAKVPISLRMSEDERRNLEATIERLKNQLISLEQQQQKTGEAGKDAGEKTGQGFEKGINSLKRFALGLFGVRSAFSAIRKATSSYLSENEVTANKLNAIWVALGNALGPIIEIIADGVLKLIGYLNVFLKALGFDIDLTKNIGKNTNAIKKQTKAMKELNREVYSFDEMNKQQKETSTSGASGGGATSNAFKMPELNQDVVRFLQDTAKWLRENWELLALIGGVIAGYKVAKWLGALGDIIGGGTGAGATGLLGLKNILTGLLALETIAIVISIIYYGKELSELKKINQEIEKFAKNNTESAKKVNKSNLDVAKSFEKGSKEIKNYTTELKNQIEASKNNISAKEKENQEMSLLDHVWDIFGGTGAKNNKIIQENTQRIINNAQNLQELAKQGKLTDDQMKVYKDTMEYLNGVYDELSPAIENSSNKVKGFGFEVDKTTKGLYDQIKGLQNTDKEAKLSTGNQKTYFQNLWTTAKNTFNNMNNLKAKPTVEVKTNTEKLKNLLKLLSDNTSTFAATGVTGGAAGLLTKMKSFGLARGGIANLPGKGVPLGNIVTGERGHEGFIPMDNEESMDLIGQSVARHVVINLTNNTMLDSRVIAREQTKIQNNQNFLTNGRGV